MCLSRINVSLSLFPPPPSFPLCLKINGGKKKHEKLAICKQKRALTRTWLGRHQDLRCAASGTVRIDFCHGSVTPIRVSCWGSRTKTKTQGRVAKRRTYRLL